MPSLLNVIYLILVFVTAPWWLYAAWRYGKYREGFTEKWLGRVPVREGDRPCIWFHAVSVGEVNLLKSLIDRAEDEFPGWDLVISTTTKTGYDLARKKYEGYPVFYAPLDFTWAVQRAIQRLRPSLLVLAELELWPNLIWAAKQNACLVSIVNARLSDRSFRRYRWIRGFLASTLRNLDLIAAQNEEYAERFRLLGAHSETVHVTGSVKFDGVIGDRRNPMTIHLKALARLSDQDIVFLAGSTQAPEEEFALQAFRELSERHPRLKLIITPRHLNRCDEIIDLLDESKVEWQLRSDLDHGVVQQNARVMLVDTIGELGAWWGVAQIAFVGGSLGTRGGQNMIEPSAYGAAVSFGPNTSNFRDVVRMLLDREAAVVVRDRAEMTEFVARCLQQPEWAAQLGDRASELVQNQQGAADRTISLLGSLVRRGLALQRDAA